MEVNVISSVTQQPNGNKKAKFGKAVASTFIPGLGQLCDGRYKDAAKYCSGAYACALLGNLFAFAPLLGRKLKIKAETIKNPKMADLCQNIGKQLTKPIKGRLFIALGLMTAAIGLHIANIVDAYKGKSEK